ncbi:TIGR03000 domain-containing protein [Gemmata sp. G18]|uniref:TIGR03000 domain-containing protein n=1 Tax=Gemmata palustris TaxID=2822762 RepID=A0ABS5C449_9BACT|nr:TIGR03000 domain-containing protein [Gemmata palustris]MBP3960776.1 TIGR03000 domain-containing protein [Gemmata palustris]
MRTVYVGCVGLVAAALVGVACAQEKKSATVTITVPESGYKETIVTVDGVELKGTGATREFTAPNLEAGKEYTFKVEARIEPNNYTKITRPREITLKAGDAAKLDLTTEDKKLDKIVVRWVPTPVDIVDEMAKLAKIGKNDVVFDPGCGDAVMLIRPVKELGAKKGIGIDIDPKMVAAAKDKAKAEGVAEKIVITEGDILNEKDMAGAAEATVVLVYIGDDLGARMSPVLQKLLKPGARVVSHRFKLGDWKPDRTVTVKGADGDDYVLHLWTVKEKEKK